MYGLQSHADLVEDWSEEGFIKTYLRVTEGQTVEQELSSPCCLLIISNLFPLNNAVVIYVYCALLYIRCLVRQVGGVAFFYLNV